MALTSSCHGRNTPEENYMIDFILSRLREPSTYAGFAGMAAAVGIAEPLYQAVTAVVMAVAGLAAIFLSEKKA